MYDNNLEQGELHKKPVTSWCDNFSILLILKHNMYGSRVPDSDPGIKVYDDY